MKHLYFQISLLLTLVLFSGHGFSQEKALIDNAAYQGAKATESSYKVIFQLDRGSDEIIQKAIRNINNLLEDPRLKGNVEIQLVAFSGGTNAFKKDSGYQEAIQSLVEKGVLVTQCLNTLKERKIDKSELYDFLGYVHTGNGELLLRAAQGWTIIKP